MRGVATVLLVFLAAFWCICDAFQIQSDAEILLDIKNSLQGNSENILLSTWNASRPLCQWGGLKWAHVNGSLLDCSDKPLLSENQTMVVHSIELAAAGLEGTIPKEVAKLLYLEKLYLGVNQLRGSIPLELGNSPRLASISLSRNKLSGDIPPSTWNLCDQLVDLLLDGNELSGPIPEPAKPDVSCPHLQVLNLSNNRLEGPLPAFLGHLQGLQELDLRNNSFSGTIPDAFSALNLSSLDLSNNNLSGSIPAFLQRFGIESFLGNNLCGSPLGSCSTKKSPGHSRLSPGLVAGIVITFMTLVVVTASLLIGITTARSKSKVGRGDIGIEFVDDETGEGKLVIFEGGEHLTGEEVLNATGQVLGKTSYGSVYKAKLRHGETVALRLLREGSCKDTEAFLSIVKDLGRLRHENVVPLRAFYEGKRGEKLLVYDYLHKGNLCDLLHDGRGSKPVLSWVQRHKIALGAAKGLAHLHTGLEKPIFHGNLKSKNVLVDENYVAHLTDYGLDRLLTPQFALQMMNSDTFEGYRAPELKKMKKADTKTDIYSFGILLLEILMGKKPGRRGNNRDEFVELPAIVKAAVFDESTLELFDVDIIRGMRNIADDDGLLRALKLAMGCCAPYPSARPDVKTVIRQLEEIKPRPVSALYTPPESRGEIDMAF